MENTSRFMRQWWNQPLCLMVRHFINRCLLFLDLAKKRVNAKRVRISLKRRSKDPSPWGVGQDRFLRGNNREADSAPGDRWHIEVFVNVAMIRLSVLSQQLQFLSSIYNNKIIQILFMKWKYWRFFSSSQNVTLA